MNFKTKIIKIEGKNLEGFFQNLITNPEIFLGESGI